MYLAVSAGLNRIVSVRNTVVTHDGRYPLRFQTELVCVRTFLTLSRASTQQRTFLLYNKLLKKQVCAILYKSMILKNSVILAFFSAASIVLGIFRDRLLAQVVGVGPMLDVYNAAFKIPDLVYGLLLSAVSAATVVPFITKIKDNDDNDLASKFNSLFFFFGGALIACSALAATVVPYFADRVVPGFDQYQVNYFITTTRILLIQPLFLGLSALIASLAQVRHRFVLYSVAPLFYTLVIIASIPTLYPRYGVYGIVWGVVGGAFLSLVIQSYTLYESRIKIRRDLFKWDYVRAHMKVAVPRSLSTVVSKFREIIFAAIATSIGIGILSIYLFAQRITDAFVQVVVQSAATAALPVLSRTHARGEHKDYARILKVNLAFILGISTCIAGVIIVFARDIVHLIYGPVDNAAAIATMARYIAWTLPVYALNIYFVSAFNATRDTMVLFYTNFIATTLGVIVLYATASAYGSLALVFGGWMVSMSYLLILIAFYSRKRRLSSAS